MKPIYLKNKPKQGYQSFVKITQSGTIEVEHDKIQRRDIDEDLTSDANWYQSEWSMMLATKQEYDEFYIKTANYINELNNL